MTIIRNGNGDVINDENPLQVKLMDSGIILPTDNQVKLAQMIQTHNAVSTPLSGTSDSVWIDTDGFDKIAVNILNDASTNSAASIYWSTDGVALQGYDDVITTGNLSQRSGITDTKARYAKIRLRNQDATLAHTMSAWVYLKV